MADSDSMAGFPEGWGSTFPGFSAPRLAILWMSFSSFFRDSIFPWKVEWRWSCLPPVVFHVTIANLHGVVFLFKNASVSADETTSMSLKIFLIASGFSWFSVVGPLSVTARIIFYGSHPVYRKEKLHSFTFAFPFSRNHRVPEFSSARSVIECIRFRKKFCMIHTVETIAESSRHFKMLLLIFPTGTLCALWMRISAAIREGYVSNPAFTLSGCLRIFSLNDVQRSKFSYIHSYSAINRAQRFQVNHFVHTM